MTDVHTLANIILAVEKTQKDSSVSPWGRELRRCGVGWHNCHTLGRNLRRLRQDRAGTQCRGHLRGKVRGSAEAFCGVEGIEHAARPTLS